MIRSLPQTYRQKKLQGEGCPKGVRLPEERRVPMTDTLLTCSNINSQQNIQLPKLKLYYQDMETTQIPINRNWFKGLPWGSCSLPSQCRGPRLHS